MADFKMPLFFVMCRKRGMVVLLVTSGIVLAPYYKDLDKNDKIFTKDSATDSGVGTSLYAMFGNSLL